MDVKRGHCWRCEKVTGNVSVECGHCKIASYCSKKCLKDDQYRHKTECEIWGPKKCNNPGCFATEKLKEVGSAATLINFTIGNFAGVACT
jgi:hypothetical protein